MLTQWSQQPVRKHFSVAAIRVPGVWLPGLQANFDNAAVQHWQTSGTATSLSPGSQPLGFGLWALLQVCLQPVSYVSDSGRYPNLLAWPSGLALSLWTLGWPWLLLLDLFCSSHLVTCECTLPSEVAGPACLAVSLTSRLAISLQSILPLLWEILYGPPSRAPEASQGIVTKTYEAFPDCARCLISSITNWFSSIFQE